MGINATEIYRAMTNPEQSGNGSARVAQGKAVKTRTRKTGNQSTRTSARAKVVARGGNRQSNNNGAKQNKEKQVHGGVKSKALTQQEKDAVNTYTSREYSKINTELRGGKVSPEREKTIKDLDSAIAKSKTTRKLEVGTSEKVYRGANIPEINAAIQRGELVGTVFSDKAYVSTTTDKSVAQNFKRGSGARMYEITVPKGSPALSTKEMSAFGSHEAEILLPRGSKFRVTGVKSRKEKYQARNMQGKVVTRTRKVEYVQMEVIS